MSVVNVKKNDFQSQVMQAEGTVLVDFWAAWCGPCRMVGPVVEEISNERQDIKVCKINIDEEPELAREFGVMSIPTLMVVKNGEVVKKEIGARPKADIVAMLD